MTRVLVGAAVAVLAVTSAALVVTVISAADAPPRSEIALGPAGGHDAGERGRGVVPELRWRPFGERLPTDPPGDDLLRRRVLPGPNGEQLIPLAPDRLIVGPPFLWGDAPPPWFVE